MEIFVEKDKLPKGYGYALKTSQLEMILADNGIQTDTHLIYYLSIKNFPILFHADYWLPNDRMPYCRLYIRTYSLPSGELEIARRKMTDDILPDFAKWVKAILSLPDNSTAFSEDLYYCAEYSNGTVTKNRKIFS